MFTHINQGSGPEGFSGYGSLLALLGNQTPTVPQQAAWGPQQCHAPTVGGLYKTFPLFNKAESSSEPSLPRVGWAGIHRALSSSRAVRRGLHLEKKKKKKKKKPWTRPPPPCGSEGAMSSWAHGQEWSQGTCRFCGSTPPPLLAVLAHCRRRTPSGSSPPVVPHPPPLLIVYIPHTSFLPIH